MQLFLEAASKGYTVGDPAAATVTIKDYATLADALNTPGWSWTPGGSLPAWSPQSAVTHDGSLAARSGAMTDNQTNWIQTTVTGPGTVSFWWKVSSETNYDYLRFYVGGAQQAAISGEVGWTWMNFAVPAGTQILRWAYCKDVSTSSGSDAGWVDQVGGAYSGLKPATLDTNPTLSAVYGPPASTITTSANAPAAVSPTLRISLSKEGRVRLSVSGLAGATCRILASENLADWTEVGLVQNAAEGWFEFADPITSGAPRRFYRAVSP